MKSMKRQAESFLKRLCLRSANAKRRRPLQPRLEDILWEPIIGAHLLEYLNFYDRVKLLQCSQVLRRLILEHFQKQCCLSIKPISRGTRQFSEFCRRHLEGIREFELRDEGSGQVYRNVPVNFWVSILRNCPQLSSISFSSSNFALNSEHLSRLSGLQQLNLGFLTEHLTNYPADNKKRWPIALQTFELVGLKELRSMKKLGLYLRNITEAVVEYLADLKELKELGLQFEASNLSDLRPLDGLENLKTLHLVPVQVPGRVQLFYTSVKSNLRLKELIIGNQDYPNAKYRSASQIDGKEEKPAFMNHVLELRLGPDLKESLESVKVLGHRVRSPHNPNDNIVGTLPNLRSLTLRGALHSNFDLVDCRLDKLEEFHFISSEEMLVYHVGEALVAASLTFGSPFKLQVPSSLKSFNVYCKKGRAELKDALGSLGKDDLDTLTDPKKFEAHYKEILDSHEKKHKPLDISEVSISACKKFTPFCYNLIKHFMSKNGGLINVRNVSEFPKTTFQNSRSR